MRWDGGVEVHHGNQFEAVHVLNFERPQNAAFSPQEIELLTAVADQAALAVKNSLLHQETVALSITDPLTGAPNRRHLFSRLEMELARAMGFNGVRKHQKIEDPRYLYWADRLGLIVW